MIPESVPQENSYHTNGELRMEIMDTRDSSVWQMMRGITKGQYKSLEVEEPYVKIGVGSPAYDACYFRRSPDGDVDGPMQSRELFGYRWHFCARPLGTPALPGGQEGPVQMSIDKYHVLCFQPGRALKYLTLPDGSEYIHVIQGNQEPELPEGWFIREDRLEKQLIVELPNPTKVFFFHGGGGSFQGPV